MKRIVLFFCLFLSVTLFSQSLKVINLKCESKENPLGIERLNPSLSWEISSKDRNVMQTAYHILVSDKIDLLEKGIGNIWDSKKILSDASIQVAYNGKPLKAAYTYFWKVQVWDNKKRAAAWSKPSQWQMGLLSPNDWKAAKWIAYEELPDSLRIVPAQENRGTKNLPELKNTLPLFRKSFTVKKPVEKASLFICGLGHFEASLNGKKVGDHFLDPGWTNYDKEALYVSFDVTAGIKTGSNAMGVMLGNGFYFIPRDRRYRKLTGAFGYPKMISILLIEYKDGTADKVVSDESWKTSSGPITYTSIYGGEDYNATLEQEGWNTTLFNDEGWKNAIVVKGCPRLLSQMEEPMKVQQTFVAQKTTKVKDGVFVFDLGQNASGIPQITVQGKKGDTVRIIPAELLQEAGTVNQKATGSPHYYDYILKGSGLETWQPSFTYYGFRYIQVEGATTAGEINLANLPVIHEVKGLHVRNAAKKAGAFNSSSELFNQTNNLIDWAIKSNMASVLTDCPHREKLGWLEQTHLMFASLQYGYDVNHLLAKTVADMMAAQTADGLVPEIAPEYVAFYWGNGMFRDSPEWGSSSIILPWYLYQSYGNKSLLQQSYPMMKKYLSYLQTKDSSHILSQGLGDWYDIGPDRPGLPQNTPMGITSTAIYYYDLTIIEKIAKLLNKEEDAREYSNLAKEVKAAFNKAFFDQQTKQYGTGSQTANAMAVYMNLVPEEYKAAVFDNIIKDIRSRNNSITAGDIGFRYLLQVLQAAGRSDVIYDLNSRTDVPGYGYQLAKGATALTESWQALPTVSNNHLMLGHLMEWFYSGLGGIKQSEASIGYKNIEINPQPVGDISFVNTSFQSPYGLIISNWKRKEGLFELQVQIPANTTATIYLPANERSVITESKQAINKMSIVKLIGNKRIGLKIGSGNYHFTVSDKNFKQLFSSK